MINFPLALAFWKASDWRNLFLWKAILDSLSMRKDCKMDWPSNLKKGNIKLFCPHSKPFVVFSYQFLTVSFSKSHIPTGPLSIMVRSKHFGKLETELIDRGFITWYHNYLGEDPIIWAEESPSEALLNKFLKRSADILTLELKVLRLFCQIDSSLRLEIWWVAALCELSVEHQSNICNPRSARF